MAKAKKKPSGKIRLTLKKREAEGIVRVLGGVVMHGAKSAHAKGLVSVFNALESAGVSFDELFERYGSLEYSKEKEGLVI